MAKGKANGDGHLADTLATLNQTAANLNQAMSAFLTNQTAFSARMAEIDAGLAETNRRMDETSRVNAERFARIESLLLEHTRILRALPEAIREKIGFKTAFNSEEKEQADAYFSCRRRQHERSSR